MHRLHFRRRTNAKCMQPTFQPGCNVNDMSFSTPFQLRERRERGFPTRLGRYILHKRPTSSLLRSTAPGDRPGASVTGWRCPPDEAHRPQLAYAGTGIPLARAHSPPRSGDATGRKCFGRRLYCHSRYPAAAWAANAAARASPPSRSRRAPTQARLDRRAGSVVFRMLFLEAREPVLGAVGGPEHGPVHQQSVILSEIVELMRLLLRPPGDPP